MNVTKINLASPKCNPKQSFGKSDDYENPVSRRTERNLAILANTAGSLVLGAATFGLTSFLKPVEKAEKGFMNYMKNHKLALAVGLAATAIAMIVTLPAKVYNTKVNAFVKQKEMDVFSRDRDLKSNLTEQVGTEVKDDKVSLDKKLDDNLKLQMANRASMVGIANVTQQPQG